MTVPVLISDAIRREVRETYGVYYERLSKIERGKLTDDVLSVQKVHEQVALIERFAGIPLAGKRVLEIGSGYGLFVATSVQAYGADTWGVEPASEGFGGSFEIAQRILSENNVDANRILEGVAEKLPLDSNSFDIVYSTNVFEHVQDPIQAFREAIRVCKPGGFIQIIIPNYGSFYEGHYATWYVPHVPKSIWKFWLRVVQRRDPHYADTLQTGLSYGSVKKILRTFEQDNSIQVISMGLEVFRERMSAMTGTPYAGLTKVFRVIAVMKRIGLLSVITQILMTFHAYSPLVISIKKNKTSAT